MERRIALHWLLGYACLAAPLRADDAAPKRDAAFESSFAAIVVRNCVTCHNKSDSKGGLDLTHRESLLKGGDSGPALEPGKPDDSFLVERVTEGSMPPKGKGRRLTKDEVAALSFWVKAGAKWPEGRVLSPFEFSTEHRAGYDWWSLQPVKRPNVPQVRNATWTRNPIDAFVLQKLEVEKLSPAPEADRITYIRRVAFDLLGLPPTPAEIDAFVADQSPEAYEKLIDRLLASPHYGERWGRHWLDVARFGESDGFENDKLRANSWPYRDYVIRSFNEDKPYTQFLREQIAGDVLEPITRDGIAATGFLVAGPWDEIQNVAKSETERRRAHEEQMEEILAAVSQTFLGLTANCARCHDHKFDPIYQVDYYRLKAIFDGVDHGNRPLFTPDEQKAHDVLVGPINAKIKELTSAVAGLKAKLDPQVADRIVPEQFAEGRFAEGFNAKRGSLTFAPKPAYNQTPLTVECWARVNAKTGFNILVASHPKESSDHWEIYTYAGSGEFSLYLPGYSPAEIKSGVDITDGKWHHVAATWDRLRARLFVDGKLVKDTEIKRTRDGGPAGPLWIGSYPPGNIGCDGVIDEVRISSDLRSIDRLPDGPFSPDDKTLALFHLNKADGDRARNSAAKSDETTSPSDDKGRDELTKQLSDLESELKKQQAELERHPVPLVYSGVRKQPEQTVVYLRGDIKTPGGPVVPGFIPAVLPPPKEVTLASEMPEARRRIAFADWLADERNPLTARVLVNRVWQHHFGQGFLDTPSDLGFNGGRPSHPELLDWLAAEFMHPSVSPSASPSAPFTLKRLHKLILLSATYRQSSRFNREAAAIDADDRLLWRYSPRRLEAEIVRDAMLAVSGELNPQIGGPSFRPFTVTALLTQFYHLIDDGRPEFNRRTIYRIAVNTAKSPFLDTLDCPAPSLTMPKRRSTTTTLQALALMNDSFVQRQATKFAERVAKSAGDNRDMQVTLAYRLALGRAPKDEERTAMRALIDDQNLDAACWVLLNASEFLYVR